MAAHAKAAGLERGLQVLRAPVVDGDGRRHRLVEGPGEPPLRRRPRVDVLHEQRGAGRQAETEPAKQRQDALARDVMDDVQHVRAGRFGVALEIARVALDIGHVVEPQPDRRPPGQRDAPAVAIEPVHDAPRRRGRIVEREEAKAAADVEHGALVGQILADLVQEPLAQDAEAYPAVGADDRVVVGADDPTNRLASHRSRSPGGRRRSRSARARSRASSGKPAMRSSRPAGQPRRKRTIRRGGRRSSPPTSSARSARMVGVLVSWKKWKS